MTSGTQHSETRYWRSNWRLTLGFCLIWLALNFGVLFFAREIALLSDWSMLAFALVQGLILAYLLLTVLFNLIVRGLQRRRQGPAHD